MGFFSLPEKIFGSDFFFYFININIRNGAKNKKFYISVCFCLPRIINKDSWLWKRKCLYGNQKIYIQEIWEDQWCRRALSVFKFSLKPLSQLEPNLVGMFLFLSCLCNSKSYNKYVAMLQTGIQQKNCIQIRLKVKKKSYFVCWCLS